VHKIFGERGRRDEAITHLNRYPFRRRVYPIITGDVAMDVLRAAEAGEKRVKTSLDLWRSLEYVKVEEGKVRLRGMPLTLEDLVELVGDERSVYAVMDGSLRRLEVRGEHFYKLINTSRGHAPTIEIDGVHMHRVKDVYPEQDSYEKLRALGRSLRGASVLDVCTGLGYTAGLALKLGAEWVLTVEKDANVLRLAEFNPWSWDMESDQVVVCLEDAVEALAKLPDGLFDFAIHDPPRFSLAGELYSGEFYGELFRILRGGGRLVHYVGRPSERFRGVRIRRGVMERLRSAGFEVRWIEGPEVVLAVKRRA